MCVATPLKIVSIDNLDGVAGTGGVEIKVRLDLLESVKVGDYVLVHAGYAIQLVDEKEAMELMGILEEISREARD